MNIIDQNKDLPLKILTRILFKKMGFCTHYEIKLRNKSYMETYKSHDISDIDVFGYFFSSDLSKYRIGAECKSGENHALDEFYKFIGIANLLNLDKGYFVKSKIHENVRNIAIGSGHITFNEAELRQMLISNDIDLEKSVKIENAIFTKITKSIKTIQAIDKKLYSYLLFEFWNKEDWRNIQNIIHLIQNSPTINSNEISLSIKFYYYNLLELFLYSILSVIHRSMILNLSDLENSLKVMLFGSPENLHERRKLLDLVNQAMGQAIPFNAEWENDFISLCYRFSNKLHAAAVIPNLLQDLKDNAFYDNKIIINKKILFKYNDITRKFLQDLIQFLIKNTNINKDIFIEIMNC